MTRSLYRAFAAIVVVTLAWIVVALWLIVSTFAGIAHAQAAEKPQTVIVNRTVRVSVPRAKPAPAQGFRVMERTFRVTAYSLWDDGMRAPTAPNFGETTSGVYVQAGVTLACPPSIPFGTLVIIEDIGPRVCQDRGSAITEGRLDVYKPYKQTADAFGVKWLKAKVVEWEGDAE